jgi:hypothetical protein
MQTVPMTVVETPFFLKKAASLMNDDEREHLVASVGLSPEAGDVIPETGGVRSNSYRCWSRPMDNGGNHE